MTYGLSRILLFYLISLGWNPLNNGRLYFLQDSVATNNAFYFSAAKFQLVRGDFRSALYALVDYSGRCFLHV